MIKHIVCWKLKNGKTVADATKMKESLEALVGKIEGLIKLEIGFDFSNTDQSFDVVLYSEFDSRQSLKNYASHPDHTACFPAVMEICEGRKVIDYEL
jgi:quinol monooxygenase YgiN